MVVISGVCAGVNIIFVFEKWSGPGCEVWGGSDPPN